MTTRDAILARLSLAERDEESVPLGATLHLRELTRLQLREAQAWSSTEDMAERERERGEALAIGVTRADGDRDAVRAAVSLFWLGVPTTATDADRWHAALFAAFVVDAETKAPLFTRDEVLTWPHRAEVWSEVRRIAQVGLNLSEVGAAPLKSGDPEAPAE